ncbi:hypothetical protein V8G54_028312, partial [Vigna mungo]
MISVSQLDLSGWTQSILLVFFAASRSALIGSSLLQGKDPECLSPGGRTEDNTSMRRQMHGVALDLVRLTYAVLCRWQARELEKLGCSADWKNVLVDFFGTQQ